MTVLVGLNGLADWSAAQPFINVLKCGRPWQGRSPTQYTSHSEAAMRSGGHLDADGNPIRIPPGADRVGTIILTEINAADTTLNGRYRLAWTGQGTLHLHGVSNIQRGNGFAEFDYRATGANLVAIELTAIDAANPLKLVACVRTDHIERYAAGEIFRPAWLDQVRGFPLFRFMDWQATNNSTQRVWADRMRASSYSYVPGAPVEVMVALCNLVGADPWFCYPHLATDDYITRFAQYVRANLRADLTAHYEFSNEVWNWQFEQAQWANRQGQALWPGQGDAWVQYYAGRSTEMADLLDAVYAGTTGRHRKVLTTQTGWIGLEPGILNAPQWVAEQAGRKAPKDAHDCYAITGYFDTGKHGQEGSVEIQQWRQLGETAAFQRMADACDASITRLIETWRYHKRAADAAGLDLVMYEGGSHIVPDHGVLNQNPGLLEFIEKFHYSAHMGRLYSRAIAGFEAAGGEAFNVFVEMARSGIHGFWGGLRHAADSNPRWDAVKAALAGTDVTPAPVDPLPDPEPEEPPVVVDPPVDPEPEQPPAEPEPEEPSMADRDKLRELLSILKTTTADLENYLSDAPVVVEPVPVDPVPVPIPDQPIWDMYTQPVLSIPTTIEVPPGTRDIYIPVSVDQCDRQSFMAYIDRLVNVNGGGINVGTSTQQRSRFSGMDVVYHWSPGDDPLHWIKISPNGSYGDGLSFRINVTVKGLGDRQKGSQVTIRFTEGAPEQQITQPFHRPLRTLDLSQAQRKNVFNAADVQHTPNGAGGTWMSALSHGRAQDGNQETGLYADASISGAVSPISYDADENALRLHSRGYTNPVRWDGREWNYQAAVLQGLHRDDVCGVEGVWRIEAKIPVRRYSWPAFWLVNRSKASAGFYYSQWPGEIDILEKFNHAWGAADTPYTSSFAQHFGPINEWQNKKGAFGNDFEVDQYGSPRTPLDEVYTSWAVHVAYDPVDTTKSEVTFFVNDREVGCQILHARHQDLTRKIEFYPIFNVAVKTPSGYTPERYNTDDGRGKTGDMLVRDVAYYPTGARLG